MPAPPKRRKGGKGPPRQGDGQLSQACLALVHELAEPLTAIGNFLDAASLLEQRHTPSAQAKLDEALKKCRAQVARANQVLRQMRDLLRRE